MATRLQCHSITDSHSNMARRSLPSVLSAWWLEQIMETASTTEWSTSAQPPSKNTCVTSGRARQQMALLTSRCQFITLKIGELSRFACLSHCTLTKLSCFILNSCRTYLTFMISKCVRNILLYPRTSPLTRSFTRNASLINWLRRQILQITDELTAIV